ncbi:ketoacyl-ACP synthase III family protein [Mycobacterium sp. LTG2003]
MTNTAEPENTEKSSAVRVGIAAATTCLPDARETAREAGIDEEDAAVCDFEGYKQVAVGTGSPVEDLAVPAAANALRRSGYDVADVDLLIYAWTHDQGDDVATPHSRLARLLGADRAVTIGIQQMSGGGAVGLEIAAEMIASGRYRTALVATADVFNEDPHTRWVERGSRSILLGDGATAAVLDRTHRPLSVCATASAGRPDTELQFFAAFAPSARGWDSPGKSFSPHAVPAMQEAVSTAVKTAFDRAALSPEDPRLQLVAFSRLGRTLLRRVYYPALPAGMPKPLQLAAETGHLGAGDLLANLAHIHDQKLLDTDNYALLVNVGMGFNTTAAIVQATR